ncbi:MAG: hypothetical protein OJF50_000234 [Nitrospira sp.]|nr:hypothetical protein [Nitrospira sp.]
MRGQISGSHMGLLATDDPFHVVGEAAHPQNFTLVRARHRVGQQAHHEGGKIPERFPSLPGVLVPLSSATVPAVEPSALSLGLTISR